LFHRRVELSTERTGLLTMTRISEGFEDNKNSEWSLIYTLRYAYSRCRNLQACEQTPSSHWSKLSGWGQVKNRNNSTCLSGALHRLRMFCMIYKKYLLVSHWCEQRQIHDAHVRTNIGCFYQLIPLTISHRYITQARLHCPFISLPTHSLSTERYPKHRQDVHTFL
jgi:hypothetical protein